MSFATLSARNTQRAAALGITAAIAFTGAASADTATTNDTATQTAQGRIAGEFFYQQKISRRISAPVYVPQTVHKFFNTASECFAYFKDEFPKVSGDADERMGVCIDLKSGDVQRVAKDAKELGPVIQRNVETSGKLQPNTVPAQLTTVFGRTDELSDAAYDISVPVTNEKQCLLIFKNISEAFSEMTFFGPSRCDTANGRGGEIYGLTMNKWAKAPLQIWARPYNFDAQPK